MGKDAATTMREDYSPHLESWENVERDAEDEDEDIL
jgi:hypothetical protein